MTGTDLTQSWDEKREVGFESHQATSAERDGTEMQVWNGFKAGSRRR